VLAPKIESFVQSTDPDEICDPSLHVYTALWGMLALKIESFVRSTDPDEICNPSLHVYTASSKLSKDNPSRGVLMLHNATGNCRQDCSI
jgi:hypothetical protein